MATPSIETSVSWSLQTGARVDAGDDAPDFTAPLANGDVEAVTLSDRLDDGPVVPAFFPGAFTSTCTAEMCTVQDRLTEFDDVGATVYGASIDTPFAQDEFRDRNGRDSVLATP